MSADDNATEQAREVEVVARAILMHVIATEDPFITCLCGRSLLTVTEWCRHVAGETAAALASTRAAELEEAAREALLAAADAWRDGDRVRIASAPRRREVYRWLLDRADGVTGRSGT